MAKITPTPVLLSADELRKAAKTLDDLGTTLGKLDVNLTGRIEIHTGDPETVIGTAVPITDGTFEFAAL